MTFRLSSWLVVAFASFMIHSGAHAQFYDPVVTFTHVDVNLGRAIVAAYPESVNERFAAEGAFGYALSGSGYVATRSDWYVGGKLGVWVSADSYVNGSAFNALNYSNSRGFSAFVGPALAKNSQRLRASMEFGIGLLAAGTSANLGNSLFSLGAAFSAHKYWMANESIGFGPGVHVLLPLFGQVSNKGPEWLTLSIGITVLGSV
jgi:hypothetical protein